MLAHTPNEGLSYPTALHSYPHVNPPKCHQLPAQATSFVYAIHCQDKIRTMEKQTYKTVKEFSITTEDTQYYTPYLTHFQTKHFKVHFNVTGSDTEYPNVAWYCTSTEAELGLKSLYNTERKGLEIKPRSII